MRDSWRLTWWARICSCSWEAELQMIFPVIRASAFSVQPRMNAFVLWYSSTCLSACSRVIKLKKIWKKKCINTWYTDVTNTGNAAYRKLWTACLSHLLQSVNSVLDPLSCVALQLCQFNYSITKLLAQKRILLSELLHSYSQLCQRGTARLTFFKKSLVMRQDKNRSEKER